MTDTERKILEAAKNWESVMREFTPSPRQVVLAQAELLAAIEIDRQHRNSRGDYTFRDI